MDYPRAFIFIDGESDMPSLASVRAWFGSKTASDVYVQGQSPVDEELDLAIKIMSHIRCFSNDWSLDSEHCIVAPITRVSLLAQTALSDRWRGISWMDSESHRESQGILSEAISGIVELEEKFIEIDQCYAGLTDYVYKKTGQLMVSEPDLNRVFDGRHFSAQTEVEAHLKVIASNETRSGVLWRMDL